jgi:TolB-like protein/cytochrome c-type biogenesis protein CcmH/NrfG
LTAIVAADVVGYSRLMGVDDTGTLAALRAHRSELVDPLIDKHGGRIVKTTGDGLLLEFPSVVAAVEFAIAAQQSIVERNEGVPDNEAMRFRIGVHVGDVIIEGDDIFGDGVNIAARIEPLAKPDGISLSDDAYRQVRDRLDVAWEDGGEHQVKNIARPIQVWHWLANGQQSPAQAPAESEPLELPDKPSIAVLPFDNMSGDPEQEYFADGMTEDIITELSKFRTLFVIARNSSFAFKGQSLMIQDIGRDLGVQYLVEGSVRKSGRRVRVTAQLVEGETGKHIWAERYDRDLDDIFAVQDEITQTIVSTLPGRLEEAGRERVKQKRTANMTAYDHILMGLDQFNRFSRENNLEARRMFQAALNHDPLYARAHALLASTYIFEVFIYAESDQTLDQAFESAEAALALDDTDGWSHLMYGFALFLRGQDEEAEIQFRRAVSLNPNDADGIAFMADVLVYFGRWEEGLECIIKAKRINPHPPAYYHWYHGLALYSAREYEQAILAIKQIRLLDRWHRGLLAMCYAQVGRLDEAGTEIAIFADARRKEMRERGFAEPISDLDLILERANKYRIEADRDHFLEGLRKAGLSL